MSTALIPAVIPIPIPFRSAAQDLNIRQKSFVDYYIEVKVGWKAAELAGYSGDRNTLMAIASENLRKPMIRAYYEERLSELAVSSSEVLAELGEMARYDVIANPRGPIRATDKLKALELAGKGHRLFGERVESDLDLDVSALASLLRAVCERARQMQQVDQAGQLDHVGQVAAIGDGHSESSAVIDVVPMGQVNQPAQSGSLPASGASGSGQPSSPPTIATATDSSPQPRPAVKPRYHT